MYNLKAWAGVNGHCSLLLFFSSFSCLATVFAELATLSYPALLSWYAEGRPLNGLVGTTAAVRGLPYNFDFCAARADKG